MLRCFLPYNFGKSQTTSFESFPHSFLRFGLGGSPKIIEVTNHSLMRLDSPVVLVLEFLMVIIGRLIPGVFFFLALICDPKFNLTPKRKECARVEVILLYFEGKNSVWCFLLIIHLISCYSENRPYK